MIRLLWLALSIIGCIYCNSIYEYNMNSVKPRFEINKVNKGVWLRHKERYSAEKNRGNFIFRANSLDAESNGQNGFDHFNLRQEGSEFARNKRSPRNEIKSRHRKSLNNDTKANFNDTPTVLNEDPYEVTVLLDNDNNKNIDFHTYPKYDSENVAEEQNNTVKDSTTNELVGIKEVETEYYNHDSELQDFKDVDNGTDGNVTIPKRSMSYTADDSNRINFLESINHGKVNPSYNFLKGDKRWQTAPVPTYTGVPKEPKPEEAKTPKPITERGLIKVLSMLTKTFKKIMKQHNDIKIMHTQMQSVNDDFKVNIDTHTKKLQEFDIKYLLFINIMEKLKTLQDKLKTQEETYRKKDEQMSRNLVQLENQQKKFLSQQQQFFNIQKLMLAQNEKINQKQNTIAKAQIDISNRQNNFARVLEKAKKMKNVKLLKLPHENVKPKNPEKNLSETRKLQISQVPTTTESITINLFSIPASNPIENQDQLILNERDERPVDELIYKYYFNNTFIDTIIKNKILSGFYLGDKGSLTRNAIQKRYYRPRIIHNLTADATVLLPVNNTTVHNSTVKRERRWINHHSKTRHRRKYNGKGSGTTRRPIYREDDINKPGEKNKVDATTKEIINKTTWEPKKIMTPYLTMAKRFCIQIGQNETKQILNWCVEKALRKLKSIDTKLQAQKGSTKVMPKLMTSQPTTKLTHPTYRMIFAPVSSPAPTTTDKISTTAEPVTIGFTQQNNPSAPRTDGFFPDNEELEHNLKQFDITKDPEGNVYYDGSLHASDLGDDRSKPISDFLPEFDSDSKVDLDPKALELQSLRHVLMNEGSRKRHARLK